MSFILRLRLGGKGYQPEPSNPVLLHAKPLGEFVDALMKLQNILEAQTDCRCDYCVTHVSLSLKMFAVLVVFFMFKT